jgi:transcriptional regulator with XRE-family HTH domain
VGVTLAEILGKHIKKLRDGRDLRQIHLAEAVGVNKDEVSKWERGERVPRSETLSRLASALSVSESALVTGRDDDDLAVTAAREEAAAASVRLREALCALDRDSLSMADAAALEAHRDVCDELAEKLRELVQIWRRETHPRAADAGSRPAG